MTLLVITLFCLLICAAFITKLALLSMSREQISADKINRQQWPTLSVIIPARNEEANIAKSLGSIVAQDYPSDKLEVIVVDDYSEDRTHAIVDQIAADSEISVRCVMGRPLPKGWIGKSNACMAGALQAKGDYLFFIDADTKSEPSMLRATIDFMMNKSIDMLSFNPRQEMVSKSERMLLPGLFLSIASSMKFKDSNDPSKDEAIANGQAMLFKRSAYDKVDGHGLVASEISEDLAFARGMKQRGFKIFWAFADDLMSTRMYTSAKEIWDGFSKNMNRIMQCDTKLSVAKGLLTNIVLAWSPLLLTAVSYFSHQSSGDPLHFASLVLSGLMLAVSIIMYLVLSKELFVPMLYAFAVPFGITYQGLILINAYLLSKRKAIQWKGRVIES